MKKAKFSAFLDKVAKISAESLVRQYKELFSNASIEELRGIMEGVLPPQFIEHQKKVDFLPPFARAQYEALLLKDVNPNISEEELTQEIRRLEKLLKDEK